MKNRWKFSMAVRAHELHIAKRPYTGDLKNWDEVSWHFLFLYYGEL